LTIVLDQNRELDQTRRRHNFFLTVQISLTGAQVLDGNTNASLMLLDERSDALAQVLGMNVTDHPNPKAKVHGP
jgi:nitrous oxide reductase accessory protein NosL